MKWHNLKKFCNCKLVVHCIGVMHLLLEKSLQIRNELLVLRGSKGVESNIRVSSTMYLFLKAN